MKCRKCAQPHAHVPVFEGGRRRGAFGPLRCKSCNTKNYVRGEHGVYWK